MHIPKRPTDEQLFKLWEELGSEEFDSTCRVFLHALAGALSFNVGSLLHADRRISEAAADAIAERLLWALQMSPDVYLLSLKRIMGNLLDAFGIDRREIREAMEHVPSGAGRNKNLDWLGDDFFRPSP